MPESQWPELWEGEEILFEGAPSWKRYLTNGFIYSVMNVLIVTLIVAFGIVQIGQPPNYGMLLTWFILSTLFSLRANYRIINSKNYRITNRRVILDSDIWATYESIESVKQSHRWITLRINTPSRFVIPNIYYPHIPLIFLKEQEIVADLIQSQINEE